MLNLTIENVIASLVPLSGAFWLIYKEIDARREKHKATVDAETEKHKATVDAELQRQVVTIEAEERKEQARIQAELDKEKVRQQAEVDKIREKGMGGEAVAKIWKSVDEIKEDVAQLAENQTKDHADGALRSEILSKLTQEVTNITKLLFENLINMRK